MEINTVHCLFEQSGTFKRAFKSHNIHALDYDILNEFNQTDHIIDLFDQIRRAYKGKESMFDTFTSDDLIFAFFPCVRFENQIMLSFRGQKHGLENFTLKEKMQHDMKLLDELHEMYDLVNMLFIICMDRGLRLIMENPYSTEHFLMRYWCYLPAVIDKDRREMGDYYKKPTQYWFLNCEPEQNIVLEPLVFNELGGTDTIRFMGKELSAKTGAKSIRKARSMIHPDYADRFIKTYILSKDGNIWL